jgi:serine protease inhibitor ecotin
MKKLLLLTLLAASFTASAWTQRGSDTVQQCRVHAPYGFQTQMFNRCILVGYDAGAEDTEVCNI